MFWDCVFHINQVYYYQSAKEAGDMNSKETRRIEYVLTTHAIEKLTPSEKAVGLCRKVTKGTVSADAAVSALLKDYGVKRMRAHG